MRMHRTNSRLTHDGSSLRQKAQQSLSAQQSEPINVEAFTARAMTRRIRLGFALAFASIFLMGCDAQLFSSPPATKCTEAAVQCELPDGPLGVCERVACSEGQPKPCFQCTPQH